eukprot:g2080.t1
MQSSQAYCISAVHDDFDANHSVAVMIRRIQSLTAVMDKVFDKILVRVNHEADRITNIDGRIADAQAKVDVVTGVKTATTVHCAAKYPASEKLEGFTCVNHDLSFKPAPDLDVDDDAEDGKIVMPSELKTSVKRERDLIALYSNINPDLSAFETDLKMGLGQLPSYLPSVSSMLLFDTTETPYKDYNVLPSLMGRSAKERKDGSMGRKIDDAPDTFLNPDAALRAQQLDFLHRPAAPDLAPMEFIDLKDFDPSFSNVASNVNFASLDSALPSIAPTAHQKSGLDLPAIMDAPGSTTSKVPDSSDSAPAAAPPVVNHTPPPPPPPPPPPVATSTVPAVTKDPPPPVATRPPASQAARAKVDPRPPEKRPPSMAGGLLGDIAKGLKLKSAKKRKLKKKKKKGKPSLADELRNRLGQRANFMSGRNRKRKKKKKKSKRPALAIRKKGDDASSKSSMNFNAIPKQRKRSSTFDDDDDDWDD